MQSVNALNESKGMILGILGVISFGLTLPVTRFVVDYMDPVFIGLGRAVVAAIVAALLLLVTKQSFPSLSQLVKLSFVAGGVVLGFPVLSAIAMQTVPASHGGVVLGILPLITAILAFFISRERPSRGFWLSAMVGSLLVAIYSLSSGGGAFLMGDLYLVAACISAAIGYVVGGQLSRELGGWQVICWALVIAAPFIIGPAIDKAPQNWQNFSTDIWLGFLYLALFSQLFGFFFWNHGLAIGGIARVSQTQLLQPFVTIVASSLLIGETLSLNTTLFALLVVASVAIGKQMPIVHSITVASK